MSPVLPLFFLWRNGWCVFLLFFKILPRVFFLAGGGLVLLPSVVDVSVLVMAYCKASQDILSLIDVTYVMIRCLNLGSRKNAVYMYHVRGLSVLYLHTYPADKL